MRTKLMDMMITKLKSDINLLQAEALDASHTGDTERCRKALQLQRDAIDNLEKTAVAKRKILK